MLLVFTPTFKTSSSAAPPGGLRVSDNVHNFIENGHLPVHTEPEREATKSQVSVEVSYQTYI